MKRQLSTRQEDFSGGMVYRNSLTRLASNEVEWAENVELAEPRMLVKRGGLTKMNSVALAGAIQGVYEHYPEDGTFHLIVVAGGTVYRYNTGTLTFDVKGTGLDTSSTTRVFFVVFGDLLIILNGVDAPQKYDPSTGTVGPLGGSPPVASVGANYYNHLFLNSVTEPVRVYHSETADCESGYGGVNYFFDEVVSDTSPVVGFLVRGSELMIGKRRSVTALRGTEPRDFSQSQNRSAYTTERGLISPHAFIEVNGVPWMASDTGIFSIRGPDDLLEESWNVGAFFDSLDHSISSSAFGLRLKQKKQANFWIPRIGAIAGNDLGLVGHPGHGREGLASWTMHTGLEFTAGHVGKSDVVGDVLYLGTNDGFVYQGDSSHADDGAAVDMIVTTGWSDYRMPGVHKTMRQTVVEAEVGPATEVVLTANTDRGAISYSKTVSLSVGGVFILGSSSTGEALGGRQLRRGRLQRETYGFEHQVDIRSSNTDEFRLSAIETLAFVKEYRVTR